MGMRGMGMGPPGMGPPGAERPYDSSRSRRRYEEYERKVPDRVLIPRLLKYVAPHWRRALIAFAAVMAATVTGLVQPLYMGMAIKLIRTGQIAGLPSVCLALIGFLLINLLSSAVQTYEISWLGQNMLYEIRGQMFSRLQTFSFGFYDRTQMGEVMSRVVNDTDSLHDFVSEIIHSVSDFASIFGAVAIMLWLSVPLTLASLIVLPCLAVTTWAFQSRLRSAYRATREKIAVVTSRLEQSISGIREIQSFARERDAMADFRQANVENLQAGIQATRVSSVFFPAVEMMEVIGTSTILLYGSYLLIGGRIELETMIMFTMYMGKLFQPITMLTHIYDHFQRAMAAAERIFDVLDTVPDVRDAPDAAELPPVNGDVRFEDVTFGYDPNHPVLHGISFHARPKETIALVGPTGAGKSTIIKLLSRFYEPQSGSVKVDGYDTRRVTQNSLHRQMGVVLQENFLFSGSIMENIRYGKPDATDEEVVTAAKLVGAHEFITQLPEGYETEVGERGKSLSVGQRQLIAFARALLRNPPLLILDEATSSIDPYTELLIKNAMALLLRDRTSLVIAHRLSTVRNADRILVLDEGRIVEEGSHAELMKKAGGLYRHLYEMQFKEPEELAAKPMIAPMTAMRKTVASNPSAGSVKGRDQGRSDPNPQSPEHSADHHGRQVRNRPNSQSHRHKKAEGKSRTIPNK